MYVYDNELQLSNYQQYPPTLTKPKAYNSCGLQ